MTYIQQPCPSCNRMLELPAEAVGRLAQCPACNATFTFSPADAAGAEQADETERKVESSEEATGASDEAVQSLGTPASPEPRPALVPRSVEPGEALSPPQQDSSAPEPADMPPPPVATRYSSPQSDAKSPVEDKSWSWDAESADGNPFTAPLESGTVQRTVNPYEPAPPPDPVAAVGELDIVPRPIEDVVSPTMTIFGARFGPLVLAFLFVVLLSTGVYFLPILGLIALADSGEDTLALFATLVAIPLVMFYGCYVSVGLARNALAVARNAPSPMLQLFPPLWIVVRFLVGAILMALAIALVSGVYIGLVVVVANVGLDGAAATLGAIGVVLMSIASFVVQWLLWSWLYVVSDGKGTAIGSIRAAYTITMNNRLTSMLLLVIAIVLSTAGTTACYIGLLVSQPLTFLMFAVAYLQMTNQPISNPRETRLQAAQMPRPPEKPEF